MTFGDWVLLTAAFLAVLVVLAALADESERRDARRRNSRGRARRW